VEEVRAALHRARNLAALDRKSPERVFLQVLTVRRTAIWRARAAYRPGWLECVLPGEARSAKPKPYEGDAERQIRSLVGSAPTQGRSDGRSCCR
jgi:hypothetical protein